MQNAKLKHYLHLHLLVFIAGFTAILGELISINALHLVWYRMTIAGGFIFLFITLTKIKIRVNSKALLKFLIAGIIIALHWVTFFESINQANISIALAMFSSGAFFASFIEPLFFKRRILYSEIAFGILVIIGVFLISQGEIAYINGIILGLLSALFSTLFAIINGRLITQHNATVISFYEFLSGILFLSIFILCTGTKFNAAFFSLSSKDWIYLTILASVCTAYAFIAAVDIMKYMSPFTVILSYNLEPVYGIVLAIALFPEKEAMSFQFYIGAVIILITVVLDAIFKNYLKQNKTSSINNTG